MDPSVVYQEVPIQLELFAHLGVKKASNLTVQRVGYAGEISGLDPWLNATLTCVSDWMPL